MNKSNLKYLLEVLLFFAIFSYLADKMVFYSLNTISDRVYTGQSIGKLNHFLKIKDTLNLIIFGSSRANHNINPAIIDKNSYNMGMDGRAIAFSGSLIKLLPLHKKQTILLQIDPYNALSKTYDGKDVDALFTKYNRNTIIRREIDRLHQDNLFQKFYNTISYNGKIIGILKNYFFPKYNYKKYDGFDPIYPTKNQQIIFKKKLKLKKKQICLNKFELNHIYNTYLDELKEFCVKNDKKLILFTSPVYEDKCKNDNNFLKSILLKKGIKYYDFTDFFKENNSFDYWKDETHLSNIGAELFSEKIKQIISK